MTPRARSRSFESSVMPWRNVAATVAILALALAGASGAWGTNIYVDGSYSGTETGSPEQPWNTISEALTYQTSGIVDGDTVIVAEGTYSENLVITDLDITITAAETDNAAAYVIDGSTASPTQAVIIYCGDITGGAIVGFTIQNYEPLSDVKGPGIAGGSVSNATNPGRAPVDVRYCTIQKCGASRGGGLSYITGTVEFCTFADNEATVGAAASNNDYLEGTFANNEVYDNTASETDPLYGVGGVQGFEFVLNNTFHDNKGYWGAAIDVCKVVRNNLIYNNRSSKGAVSSVLILESNTIYGNTNYNASSTCAGVYLTPVNDAYFDENAQPDDPYTGGDPVIRNNVMWGNERDGVTEGQQLVIIHDEYDGNNYNYITSTVKNCCIQGSSLWTGASWDDVSGLTNADPDLVNPTLPGTLDFHIDSSSSPCIDAGVDISTSSYEGGIYEDVDGDPRPIDGDGTGGAQFDIGADEYYSGSATAPYKETITLSTTPSVTMTMVWIPKGKFTMGSPPTETDRASDEGPQHEVLLSRGFWISESELTMEQWYAVMGTTPWSGQDNVLTDDDEAPAVYVDWDDAQAFVIALNDSISGPAFALPTEAQWEYACRAGTTTAFYWASASIGLYAWYYDNAYADGYAHVVSLKTENAWDLYDMGGNVWEWCRDLYGTYPSSFETDPTGSETGYKRMARGGCWNGPAHYCRSARRGASHPNVISHNLGIRVCRASGYAAKPCVDAFAINGGSPAAQRTGTSLNVTLNATCTGRPTQYTRSETSSFPSSPTWYTYDPDSPPTLSLSTTSQTPETRTVYFKVRNAAGTESEVVSDSIVIAPPLVIDSQGLNLEMVWVPAGTFLMGAHPAEPDAQSDEQPQHEVTLSSGFYIGKYEITKAQWETVMGTPLPWANETDVSSASNSPAVYVTWDEIAGTNGFIDTINGDSAYDHTGYTYALPTEAQWEYACRAGSGTRFHWSHDLDLSEISTYAWWTGDNSGSTTEQPVGQNSPNGLGLYDMSGNVWEWCQDRFGAYPSGSVTDPTGPTSGTNRVARGGCWNGAGHFARSAKRASAAPSTVEGNNVGFRVCLVPNP